MAARHRAKRSEPQVSPEGATPSPMGAWWLIGAVVALLAIGGWWAARDRAFTLTPEANQNVLLVTIDALRADALSVAGGRASTPVLDALAARGARFTFAHANTVSTLPSHATIFTGLLPPAHGVRADRDYPLTPGVSTMAERLRSAGLATGAFVGSSAVGRRAGLGAGFDAYDERMLRVADVIDLAASERPADAVVRAASNWIGQQPDRWFAWVHLTEPRAPYEPAEQFSRLFPSDAYLAEVIAADTALGPLIDSLQNESRPTLVVVTGDHGEGLGEHGEETHGLFAYESTLHVPLIVAQIDPASSTSPGGVVSDAPVQHIDILPTVLEALAMDADAALPGQSLRQLDDRARPTYFEALSANITRGWAPLRGVIVGREKYIDLPVPELYDLAADADEQRNQASVQPARVEALASALSAFDVSPPAAAASASPDIIERLRSLGYLSSPQRPHEGYTEADDPKRLVDYDRVMDAALVAFEQGRAEDAAAGLQQVILERPGNADAYKALAVVFWHGGLPDQGIITLQAALHAGLTGGGIRVLLGQMLARTAGAARAVRLLEGQTGDDPEALAALGIAYSQVGRNVEAEAQFRRMLAIDPNDGRAHEHLGVLELRQGRFEDAEASLRRAIAFNPGLSTAYTTLGVALSDQGRIDEAIETWRQAVALDPNEMLALYNLTLALAASDRRTEAEAAGRQFLQSAPPALFAEQRAQISTLLGGG